MGGNRYFWIQANYTYGPNNSKTNGRFRWNTSAQPVRGSLVSGSNGVTGSLRLAPIFQSLWNHHNLLTNGSNVSKHKRHELYICILQETKSKKPQNILILHHICSWSSLLFYKLSICVSRRLPTNPKLNFYNYGSALLFSLPSIKKKIY